MAEKWTNTSGPPPSTEMKPKPFSALNHFTTPCAMCSPKSDAVEAAASTVPAARLRGPRAPLGGVPEGSAKPVVRHSTDASQRSGNLHDHNQAPRYHLAQRDLARDIRQIGCN